MKRILYCFMGVWISCFAFACVGSGEIDEGLEDSERTRCLSGGEEQDDQSCSEVRPKNYIRKDAELPGCWYTVRRFVREHKVGCVVVVSFGVLAAAGATAAWFVLPALSTGLAVTSQNGTGGMTTLNQTTSLPVSEMTTQHPMSTSLLRTGGMTTLNQTTSLPVSEMTTQNPVITDVLSTSEPFHSDVKLRCRVKIDGHWSTVQSSPEFPAHLWKEACSQHLHLKGFSVRTADFQGNTHNQKISWHIGSQDQCRWSASALGSDTPFLADIGFRRCYSSVSEFFDRILASEVTEIRLIAEPVAQRPTKRPAIARHGKPSDRGDAQDRNPNAPVSYQGPHRTTQSVQGTSASHQPRGKGAARARRSANNRS